MAFTLERFISLTPARYLPKVSITLNVVRKIKLRMASESALPSRKLKVEAEVRPGKTINVIRKV